MLLKLINHVAIITIISYLLTRTKLYEKIVITKKIEFKHKLILTVILGVFSIYGTIHGIKFNTAIANIRDLGPAIGGLIAGPLVGFGAGLIGALYRFSLGGITKYSCSLATLIIGAITGIIYLINKKKIVSLFQAVLIVILLQILHMGIALLFGFLQGMLEQTWQIVVRVFAPMAIANGIGMAIFMYISINLVHERKTEKEKEKMDRELEIAHNIQMEIIPKIFPPFPKRKEFQLHAIIDPAKKVGGDLYDFFFLDVSQLCLVIGDVSGKGVPASLFMAVTKTLVKAYARIGRMPSQILSDVNKELCSENDSAMFVTLFLAILNTKSGEFQYCNAGHNNPYIVNSDGSLIKLDKTKGIALGIMDSADFSSKKQKLKKNDTLFLYTDGINEAMDKDDNQFSYHRMEKMLPIARNKSPQKLIKYFIESINEFTKDAEQSDIYKRCRTVRRYDNACSKIQQ